MDEANVLMDAGVFFARNERSERKSVAIRENGKPAGQPP